MSDVTDLIGRVRYILDPTASASERLHRRSHLTNRDLRTIVAALERLTRPADDVVEAARKAIVSYVFSETQPDRGDVFSWLDDHAEQIARAALASPKQTDAVEAERERYARIADQAEQEAKRKLDAAETEDSQRNYAAAIVTSQSIAAAIRGAK